MCRVVIPLFKRVFCVCGCAAGAIPCPHIDACPPYRSLPAAISSSEVVLLARREPPSWKGPSCRGVVSRSVGGGSYYAVLLVVAEGLAAGRVDDGLGVADLLALGDLAAVLEALAVEVGDGAGGG